MLRIALSASCHTVGASPEMWLPWQWSKAAQVTELIIFDHQQVTELIIFCVFFHHLLFMAGWGRSEQLQSEKNRIEFCQNHVSVMLLLSLALLWSWLKYYNWCYCGDYDLLFGQLEDLCHCFDTLPWEIIVMKMIIKMKMIMIIIQIEPDDRLSTQPLRGHSSD